MKNSHLFEAVSTPSCPIWARSYKDWADVSTECVRNSRRYPISSAIFFLFCRNISTNTAPLGNWVQTLVKYVENTRRYSVSPVFFSCFTAFSEPTQLHSIIEFKP